jgi:hypothetical protein
MNSHLMSLGGIAIAIGAMIDAAIVMIENAHKHLERLPAQHSRQDRAAAMLAACQEVGTGAVLLAADHHRFLPAGLQPGGPGRAAVLAARLHQDLCHGRRGDPVGDAGAGADAGASSAARSCRKREIR